MTAMYINLLALLIMSVIAVPSSVRPGGHIFGGELCNTIHTYVLILRARGSNMREQFCRRQER